MKTKTAIVTGTSSGFGLITSVELARKGFTVIAAMRNCEKKEESLRSHSPYYVYMQKIEEYIAKGENSFGNPEDVAKEIAEIALLPNPNIRYPIGTGVKATILFKNLLPWKLWEKIVLSKLFGK